MAQDYTIDSYRSDHIGQNDLQNMENNFECLRSLFSGTSAPANALAGHPWYDTGASARNAGDNQNILKVYNGTRSAWYGVMTGDISQKMIVYRNDQLDSWVIDTSVTDSVVAIKGGSVYTTGGATAGTWQSSTHALSVAETPAHAHPGTSQGSHSHTVPAYNGGGSSPWRLSATKDSTLVLNQGTTSAGAITIASQGGGGTHVHEADANVRPTAAVCTIQYLDI